MKTISRLYLVDRQSVCFIKFIFEAYDGIALLRTIDPHASKIELLIAPGCEADVEYLIADLRHDFLIESVD
jgi:hypothetical protein